MAYSYERYTRKVSQQLGFSSIHAISWEKHLLLTTLFSGPLNPAVTVKVFGVSFIFFSRYAPAGNILIKSWL